MWLRSFHTLRSHTEIWSEFAIQWQHRAMRVVSRQSKVMIGYMRTDEKPAAGNCLLFGGTKITT